MILEIIGAITLTYWFCRLLLPVMEWLDIEKRKA